jgi:hypothetical protein
MRDAIKVLAYIQHTVELQCTHLSTIKLNKNRINHFTTVLGTDLIPVITDPTVTMTASRPYIGTVPLAQLIDEWNDRNNTA